MLATFRIARVFAAGALTLPAACGACSSSEPVAGPPMLVGVSVTPETAAIGITASQPLAAIARYSDASTSDITTRAAWSSTAPAIASVSAGVVTGVAAGTAGIVASLNGKADTSTITVTTTSTGPLVLPLKVGPTSRYLTDQNGTPFLLVGDAAWSLIVQVPDADADAYLASRQSHGFNLVLISLIDPKFATNAPANYYLQQPFTGLPFRSAPSEAYFAHADYVIRSAASKGITVLLAPAYLGYLCADEGWCAEIQAASIADMTAWGEYLGNRYRDFDNIVWLIGGDTDPPADVKAKLQAMVDGIQQHDTRHLFSAHNANGQMAIASWSGAPWLTVNNIYTYGLQYTDAQAAYSVAPAMPFFLVEAHYEGDQGISQAALRSESYWTVLSGGFGHIFGNCPLWSFGAANRYCATSDWRAQLSSQGTLNMQYFAKLFRARHWYSLVPDVSHTVLIAGAGTAGQATYAIAASASDGSSIIAYLPSSRTVTVNGSVLSGPTMTAWWYNPSTGSATSIGTFPTSAPQTFTPPFDADWVLVLDSSAFNFPPL